MGLQSSFPVRPSCFSAFRLWSASLALPTARPTLPAADFRCRAQNESLHSQSHFRDPQRISRGKLDRLLRATTEFTPCAFDRYGLRDHVPARPTLTPQIQFLYIGSRICSTLFSDSALRRRPCASLSLHLYQVVKRTLTFKLSNMLGTHKKAVPEDGHNRGGTSEEVRTSLLTPALRLPLWALELARSGSKRERIRYREPVP